MTTKSLAYQNHPEKWTITLLNQDISSYTTSNINVSQSLDLSNISEILAGSASIEIDNQNDDFSTDRTPNFFTRNDYVRTGRNAPIIIRAGYNVNGTITDEIIFEGFINNIRFNKKTKVATLEAIDQSSDLREDNLVNFGVQKSSRLGQNTAGTSIHGEYPFSEAVTPVSDESVFPFLNGVVMKDVVQLDGVEYRETNFALNSDNTAIETQIAITGTTPLLTALYKAPFKYSPVRDSVLKIAYRYNIGKRLIKLGGVSSIDPHFEPLGKIQYYTEQSGTAIDPTDTFEFTGFITDFIYDEDTGNFYFLESSFDPDIFPRLVRYSLLDSEFRILFTAPSHFEWWQLASGDFNTFYIGQTTGTWTGGKPDLGAYNAGETGVQTSIRQHNITTSTDQTFNTSGTRRLQLAYFYNYGFNPHMGEGLYGNPRYGFRPDSRFGFIFHDDKLYYRFANTTHFGLASMTSSGTLATVINIPRDGRNNESSFDFDINPSSDLAYGSHTVRSKTDSTHLVYEKSL